MIGIGSNSLRLLVADISGDRLSQVLRERIGLRMFASLDQNQCISNQMLHHACEAVWMLQQTARNQGAEIIRLFATSAVRDAKNKQALQDALKHKTGLDLNIISGEMEAKLSFLGVARNENAGMIDIGGGSTEIVSGDQGNILYACSVQVGAVRLFKETAIKTADDVAQVENRVRSLLAPHIDIIQQKNTPTLWVGVGGTMTVVATYLKNIPWNSKDGIHGFVAKRSELCRGVKTLSTMKLSKRTAVHSIPPDRADIIVHGFIILNTCMEMLGIDEITISEHTNLDGYLQMIKAGE